MLLSVTLRKIQSSVLFPDPDCELVSAWTVHLLRVCLDPVRPAMSSEASAFKLLLIGSVSDYKVLFFRCLTYFSRISPDLLEHIHNLLVKHAVVTIINPQDITTCFLLISQDYNGLARYIHSGIQANEMLIFGTLLALWQRKSHVAVYYIRPQKASAYERHISLLLTCHWTREVNWPLIKLSSTISVYFVTWCQWWLPYSSRGGKTHVN